MALSLCFLNKKPHICILSCKWHSQLRLDWRLSLFFLLHWARLPFWNLMDKLGFSGNLTSWGEPRVMIGSQKHSCRPGGKEKQLCPNGQGLSGRPPAAWIPSSWWGLRSLTLPTVCVTFSASWAEHFGVAAGVQANWVSACWAGHKIPMNHIQGQYYEDTVWGLPQGTEIKTFLRHRVKASHSRTLGLQQESSSSPWLSIINA